MEEKVIVITGASGGMGSEVAKFFVEQGARLMLHSNNNPIPIPESDKIKKLAKYLRFLEFERLDEFDIFEILEGVEAKIA